ncbi:hypothetical protein BGZ60DRAFT_259462 [Tricladium varicosporioides]|nr:hypothetical protein BGZ60DRAFT_259462 [Hymenoscyphus varicosporioides]
MDPVTAVGAVASIVTLAQTAISLSQNLYTLGSAVASASEDVQILADDLRTFAQSLTLLSRLLEDSKSWYSDDVYLLTAKIIRDCADLYVKIDRILVKLGSSGKSNWKLRVKFVYKEGQIRKLMKRLQDMKGTLATILMSLQVDLQLSLLNISSSSKIQRKPEKPLDDATIQNLKSAQQTVQACNFFSEHAIRSKNSVQHVQQLQGSVSEDFNTAQSCALLQHKIQKSPAHVVCTAVTGSMFANLNPQHNKKERSATSTADSKWETTTIRSIKSASSVESFKSALSAQEIDNWVEADRAIKSVQSVLHAFRTALNILDNLINRRMHQRSGGPYNSAIALRKSLVCGDQFIDKMLHRLFLDNTSRSPAFKERNINSLAGSTDLLLKSVITKLHMLSAEHEDPQIQDFNSMERQADECRRDVQRELTGILYLERENDAPPTSPAGIQKALFAQDVVAQKIEAPELSLPFIGYTFKRFDNSNRKEIPAEGDINTHITENATPLCPQSKLLSKMPVPQNLNAMWYNSLQAQPGGFSQHRFSHLQHQMQVPPLPDQQHVAIGVESNKPVLDALYNQSQKYQHIAEEPIDFATPLNLPQNLCVPRQQPNSTCTVFNQAEYMPYNTDASQPPNFPSEDSMDYSEPTVPPLTDEGHLNEHVKGATQALGLEDSHIAVGDFYAPRRSCHSCPIVLLHKSPLASHSHKRMWRVQSDPFALSNEQRLCTSNVDPIATPIDLAGNLGDHDFLQNFDFDSFLSQGGPSLNRDDTLNADAMGKHMSCSSQSLVSQPELKRISDKGGKLEQPPSENHDKKLNCVDFGFDEHSSYEQIGKSSRHLTADCNHNDSQKVEKTSAEQLSEYQMNILKNMNCRIRNGKPLPTKQNAIPTFEDLTVGWACPSPGPTEVQTPSPIYSGPGTSEAHAGPTRPWLPVSIDPSVENDPPLFVNPKQFHRLLKRRQVRQKQEDPRKRYKLESGQDIPDNENILTEESMLNSKITSHAATVQSISNSSKYNVIDPKFYRPSSSRIWLQAYENLQASCSPIFGELAYQFGVFGIEDSKICTRISKLVHHLPKTDHDRIQGLENIFAIRENVIHIITMVDQQMGLETATIGWCCVWACLKLYDQLLECLAAHPASNAAISATEDSFLQLLDITGTIARYAVMENLYQQSRGALSLKEDYQTSLISLCESMIIFFSDTYNQGSCFILGNYSNREWKGREIVAEIRRKDEACRTFKVVVDMKEESDNDTEATEEEEREDSSDGSWENVEAGETMT